MTALGLSVGSLAPDFQLPDHRGGKVRLSDFRERQAALLVFFPFAFTEVCTSELAALDSFIDRFHERGVNVFGVSCDNPYALAEFATRARISFDLLSDFWPHGEVSRQYGVFLEDKGFAMRGSFLIDLEGRIAWAVLNGPAEERELSSYEAAMAALT
ncbi:MAG: peroxiredoxin [Actinomycetota bacterium]|nr:peroxiredoxin [Actinomycetota bacterium]